MNNQVLIAENSKTGQVVMSSSYVDKETGEEKSIYKIMVTQTSFNVNNGYVNEAKRTAFITLDEKSFNAFDKAGILVDGAVLPIAGKLVVEETLVPYIIKSGPRKGQKQEPKRAGINGAVITHQGQPVYRNTNFTTDMNAQDVLLASDKRGVSQESSEEEVTE